MVIDLRKAAKAAGMRLYFTGEACERGHVIWRRVDTGECTACRQQDRSRAYMRAARLPGNVRPVGRPRKRVLTPRR